VVAQRTARARARLKRESFVPMHLALRFGEDIARNLDAPDFGIWLARRQGFDLVGEFGRSIRSAPTLYGAVSVICSMATMHNSGARFWLAPEGDSVLLCRRFRCEGGAFRQSDLISIELMVNAMRFVAGPDWMPSRVDLQSTDPRRMCPPSLRESLAEGEVREGCLATSITFPRALLSRRVPGRNRPPVPAPVSSWLSRTPPTEFLTSVDLVIESTLDSEQSDVAAVARAAGLSVRSFQRRLADAGASYSKLVDRVRFRKAMDWLHDPHVKIIEIAFALGYPGPAHFTRAFRRWTSLTPLQYRYLHGLAQRQTAGGSMPVSGLPDLGPDARRRSRTTARSRETAMTRAERCAGPPPGRRGRSRPRAGSTDRTQ
jgi:AraC-like DNA-binding protein